MRYLPRGKQSIDVEQSPKKLAVKLKEAAAMLSISEISLRRKIETGEIAACRAFRHITISVDELSRFLARNTVKR
jgi:hypothetical protein